MRFREIFRYELAYRLRTPSTWIYAGILFLVSVWTFLALAEDGGVNTPVRLAGHAVMVGLFGMLVSAAIFGDAAVRDVEVEMDSLLFTSPLGKVEYLGGRFLAAFTVNAVVLLVVPLAQEVATRLPLFEPEEVLPFRLVAYLQPLLLFQLPNLFLVGAVLFTIAALTRQAIPVYLGAIGLLIVYLIAANHWGHIDNPTVAVLADALGIGVLQDMSRYWTEVEQRTRLIGFPALLVWNRILWLALAAAVLALLVPWFRFAHREGRDRRRRGRPAVEQELKQPEPVAVPRIAGSFGLRTTVRQTLGVARHSLAEVAASRWFAVVLLACVGLTMLWGWNVGDTVFDTSTWPVTLLIVEEVLTQRAAILPYILITLYAGELVWKHREAGAAEIVDAAPVAEGVALLGRFLALVVLVGLFQVARMVGGLLIQALQGYHHFEIGLYLRVVFGLNLADYLLFAALAMTVHVLVNHKYLGHIAVLLTLLATKLAEMTGLVGHHLLLYGTDPGWTYSDMNGFGPFAVPFVWFKLYWGAWALVLGLVAALFWVRGREPGFLRRLRVARARFRGPTARTAGAAALLILGLGGFIFYNTNVLNAYYEGDEQGAPLAEYERRYGRFADTPQPTITDADLRVEIYPGAPAVDLRGSYRLLNRTDAPIDSVHVYVDREVEVRSISFDRTAEPVVVDEEVGYRIYALGRALEPGESLRLVFDVAFRPRGFPNGDIQTDVVGNGASFNRSWLPWIGYQPMFELSEREAREHFRLGPPRRMPDDAVVTRYRWPWRDADLVQVNAVLGTTAEQTAIMPGLLRRSWTENGRRYFHYETEVPTAFGATVFSAEYELLEDRWNDVGLSIFHHPAHDANLDRMVRGMKAALAYLSAEFGPYPDPVLRIVETPRYGGFGSAHPQTIAFTEDVFFTRVREGEIDQTFFGTAHEVAHHWWGGQVRGAPVPGAGLLSESLANYSALMVTEKTYGPEVARRAYGFQMERYLTGRANFGGEVPLLQVTDQPYIAYRKGALALYTLREHIGEERVNTAIRRYFEKHREGRPPYPTSRDLYAELHAVTPDSLRYLLTDFFQTITLWDVRTERAVMARNANGEYQVTLDVVARKMRADRDGNETEVPMDDLVEVGVFAAGREGGLGEPLYLRRHRIRSGAQTIRVTVPREPALAGIDPFGMLIDRVGGDNVEEVEIET